MRALPADSLEYLGETADGNLTGPLATGGGALGGGALGGGAAAVDEGGGAFDAGASAASPPHSALRTSFQVWPWRVPPSVAAWYLVLHSFIDRACAGTVATVPARALRRIPDAITTCIFMCDSPLAKRSMQAVRQRAYLPVASDTHFLVKLVSAAPCRFLAAAWS